MDNPFAILRFHNKLFLSSITKIFIRKIYFACGGSKKESAAVNNEKEVSQEIYSNVTK